MDKQNAPAPARMVLTVIERYRKDPDQWMRVVRREAKVRGLDEALSTEDMITALQPILMAELTEDERREMAAIATMEARGFKLVDID